MSEQLRVHNGFLTGSCCHFTIPSVAHLYPILSIFLSRDGNVVFVVFDDIVDLQNDNNDNLRTLRKRSHSPINTHQRSLFLYPPRTKSSALRATSTEVRGKPLFQYDKFIITLSSTTFLFISSFPSI